MTIELTQKVRMRGPNCYGTDRHGNEVNLSELEFCVIGKSEDGKAIHIAPTSGWEGWGWDVTVDDVEVIS